MSLVNILYIIYNILYLTNILRCKNNNTLKSVNLKQLKSC